MMTKEGSTKTLNFMTPGAGVLVQGCGHKSHKVKMHYFLLHKKSSSLHPAYIRQTKCIVMMAKEGSTKTLNFMTPDAGVLVQGCGHISHKVKMHYFLFHKKSSSLHPGIHQTN